MLIIIGFVVVLGAVLGGFLMAGGTIAVLIQPSEFVVIGGAAVGSLLISTPPKIVKMLIGQVTGAFGSGPSRSDYVDLLAMQYQIFKLIQQSGVMALEAHFEDPAKSPLLSHVRGRTIVIQAVGPILQSTRREVEFGWMQIPG